MTLLRETVAVAGKDLRIELRGRHALTSALPFAATLLLAFGLSLGPSRTLLQETAPALLWLAVLFAAVISFRKAYQVESEDGALEGLVLSPVDRGAVFLGKALAVTLELLVLEAGILILVSVLFGPALGGSALVVAAAFVLGTLGLAAVGSLFGVLAESARAREAVFPLLVIPLVTPVLVAGIRATALAAEGANGEAASWLGLLAAFDVIFVAVGTVVYGYLLEDG